MLIIPLGVTPVYSTIEVPKFQRRSNECQYFLHGSYLLLVLLVHMLHLIKLTIVLLS